MYEGSFVTVSEGGDDLYWTRWIFYGLSCSLLMYAISKALKFSNAEMVKLIYLTVIVMFTGALASVYQMEFKWVMFAVSTIAYLIMIYPVVTSKAKSAASILPFIFFGWSVFPIIFLVSPEGLNLIGNPLSAGIYLGLDFLTKIVFYFVVPQRN
jgi:bacteriorhodopsin